MNSAMKRRAGCLGLYCESSSNRPQRSKALQLGATASFLGSTTPATPLKNATPSHTVSSSKKRRAFSLLEVMLAIAILGMSMVVLSQFIGLGSRNAVAARESTIAQMLCETKMAEFTSKILTPEAGGPLSFEQAEYDADWEYYVDLQPAQGQVSGLMALTVTVRQQSHHPRPIEYSLVRWIPDPSAVLVDPFAELEEAAAAAGTMTDSSTTTPSTTTPASGATTPMSTTGGATSGQ